MTGDAVLTSEHPEEYTARVVNYLRSLPLNHVSHSYRSYEPKFTPTLQAASASWLVGNGGQDLSIGTRTKIVFSVVSNYER